jgi:hypothetical protein
MLKFIGKAMAALMLTRDARKAVRRRAAGATKGPPKSTSSAADPRATLGQGIVTPERAELIRKALQVRAAKQTVLAELADEDRTRLVAAAMKALLNQGQKKE